MVPTRAGPGQRARRVLAQSLGAGRICVVLRRRAVPRARDRVTTDRPSRCLCDITTWSGGPVIEAAPRDQERER